jgi:type I restriction enzyme, S subunit
MNAERSLALYERVAEAPNAITRLRRFILDLAVRGKLTDCEFETGRSVPLGKLAEFIMGQAPPGNSYNDGGQGTIFVKVGEFGERFPIHAAWTTEPLKFAKRGDVLICVVGATIGKLNLGIDCAIGRSVAAIRPQSKIDQVFLYYSLMPFTLRLREDSRGTAQGVISRSDLAAITIWCPPLAEQHRIVAKVDELMALCDRLEAARKDREAKRDRLSAASLARLNTPDPETFTADARFTLEALPALTTRPNQIKQLRQTILNLAVRGKLVPQDPQDEPAPELLTRIIRHEETGSKKRLFNAEIVVSNQTSLHVLPPSWVWARLDVLAKKITDGEHLSPIKTNDGMKLLTAAHVTAKGLSLDNPQFVSIEDGNRFRNRCDPKRDDLLICSRGTIGRCAIIDTDEIFCLMGSVILLRPPSELSSRYLLAYLSTEATQKLMQGMSGATAVKALYLKDIRNCPVPIPPLAEQHRIVAKVDELMALCDRLEASLTTSDQTRTRLLEATLTEALMPANLSDMEKAK